MSEIPGMSEIPLAHHREERDTMRSASRNNTSHYSSSHWILPGCMVGPPCARGICFVERPLSLGTYIPVEMGVGRYEWETGKQQQAE